MVALVRLRDAIICANAMPGPNTISLPAGIYALDLVGAGEDAAAFGDLDITDDLIIVGDDAESTFINATGLDPDGAGAAFGDRIFHVHGVVFNLNNVTILGGNVQGDGGGLLNDQGSVTLTDVIVDANAASDSGGGLATFGSRLIPITLNLDGVTVLNNHSLGSGGGVFSGDDTLNIIRSEIRDNRSQTSGGGIQVASFTGQGGNTLNLAESSVSGNRADGDGGGIAGFSETINIRDSTISDNTAGGHGGAIESLVTELNIIRTTLDSNTATLEAGGIFNDGGTADIAETTLSNNVSGADGGAIVNLRGTLSIMNSTISGNTAADDGQGGGIHNGGYGSLNLLNTTITANRAGHGAGLEISSSATNTLLGNTIVAGNTNVESAFPGDIFGNVDSISVSNLIGDGSNLSGISDGAGAIKSAPMRLRSTQCSVRCSSMEVQTLRICCWRAARQSMLATTGSPQPSINAVANVHFRWAETLISVQWKSKLAARLS